MLFTHPSLRCTRAGDKCHHKTHKQEIQCKQRSTPGHRARANSSNVSGYIFSSWGWQDRLGVVWSFIVPPKSLDFIPNVIKKELKSLAKKMMRSDLMMVKTPLAVVWVDHGGQERDESRELSIEVSGEELGYGLLCWVRWWKVVRLGICYNVRGLPV